jgi:hypothetical protein
MMNDDLVLSIMLEVNSVSPVEPDPRLQQDAHRAANPFCLIWYGGGLPQTHWTGHEATLESAMEAAKASMKFPSPFIDDLERSSIQAEMHS